MEVEKNQPLVTIHANDQVKLAKARALIESAFKIAERKPAERPLVYETIPPKRG
jgi:thymidine phosphorylase